MYYTHTVQRAARILNPNPHRTYFECCRTYCNNTRAFIAFRYMFYCFVAQSVVIVIGRPRGINRLHHHHHHHPYRSSPFRRGLYDDDVSSGGALSRFPGLFYSAGAVRVRWPIHRLHEVRVHVIVSTLQPRIRIKYRTKQFLSTLHYNGLRKPLIKLIRVWTHL